MASNITVKGLSLGIQAGTDRTFYASWSKVSGTHSSHVDSYSWEWEYRTNSKWFDGQTGTSTSSTPRCTYSPPDNAIRVRFRVKPISKTYKKTVNKKQKEYHYFTGNYTTWKEKDVPKSRLYKAKASISGNVEISSGSAYALSATVNLSVTKSDTVQKKATLADYFSGLDCKWEFWNGYVWSEGGTYSSEVKATQTVYYQGTIPSDAYQVRLTAIPSSDVCQVETASTTTDLVLSQAKVDTKNITIGVHNKSNREIYASWSIGITRSNIDSFEVEWAVWKSGLWQEDSSSTVKAGSFEYSTNYTIPDNVDTVRFRVKPVTIERAGYSDEWSDWMQYTFSVPTRDISDAIYVAPMSGADRTLSVSWAVSSPGSDSDASYTVQWRYQTESMAEALGQNLWFYDKSESIPFENGAEMYHTENDPPWYSYSFFTTYEYPESAKIIEVRVTPVPRYDNAYTGSPSKWFRYSVDIPKRSVKNVRVSAPDPEARVLLAQWSIDDATDLDHYEYRWDYYQYDIWMEGDPKTASINFPQATYNLPDNVNKARITVKPIPKFTSSFSGEESLFAEYTYDIPPRQIEDLQILRVEGQDRALTGIWNISDNEHVKSYTYQWRYSYRINATTTAWAEESESSTTTMSTSMYSIPDNAITVELRVKPEPTAATYFTGEYSPYESYNVIVFTRQVWDINCMIQRGSTRTVVATWNIDNSDDVDSYEYQWRYSIDDIWYDGGSSGTVSFETANATYEAPEIADYVEIKVRPVPKYSLSFIGEWSEYAVFGVPEDTTPEKPGTPNVEISGYNVTATIDTYDSKTDRIEFQIVTSTDIWDSGIADVVLNRAVYVFTVASGEKYRVRCRGINGDDEYGEWSEYSSDVTSFPAAIENPPEVSALSATSVAITWEEVETATSYTIEYATKERYFDAAPDQVKSTTINAGTRAEITGLDSGEDWFFRIKATNSQGDSEWSEVVSVTLGTIPDPPTTWSSTSTATISRDVYLYWMHNSEDNSAERAAELELTVNGSTIHRYFAVDGEELTGKNLLPLPFRAYYESGSREFLFTGNSTLKAYITDDRTVEVTGTGDGHEFSRSYEDLTIPAGEYILSGCPGDSIQSSYGLSIEVRWTDESGQVYTNQFATSYEGGSIVELEYDAKITSCTIWIANGYEIDSENPLIFKPMLSLRNDEDEHEYEPYIVWEEMSYTDEQSYYLIEAGTYANGTTIEWRVRTMGVVDAFGDWSVQRIIKLYAPPTLNMVLSEPGNWVWDPFNFTTDTIYSSSVATKVPIMDSTIRSLPILIYLTSAPTTQTPVTYVITVIANESYDDTDDVGRTIHIIEGQEIFRKYYYTAEHDFMVAIDASEINLETDISYTFKATVAMDSGLTADAEQRVIVEWEETDVYFDAEFSYDEEAKMMYLRPYAETEDGYSIPNILISVYRRDFDGDYTEIARNLPSESVATITDPHPSLDYARYRIVGRSKTTAKTDYYDLPAIPIGETSIIIQWDETWDAFDPNGDMAVEPPSYAGSMIELPYNVDTSDSNEVDVSMIEYIGRKHPVSYYGTQVGQTSNWSTDIPKEDKELIYALRRLSVYMGNAYVREPSGTGYWAHVSVSFDIKHNTVIVPVSLSVTRVEGGK